MSSSIEERKRAKREYNRQLTARKMAEDPEGFRARHREICRRTSATTNAARRAERVVDPEGVRLREREYYDRRMADPVLREARRENVRKWKEKNPDRDAENRKRWKARNRDKIRAQTLLNTAIRDGKVERPSECSRCGVSARIDGHHGDYQKPFDVTWLCRSCHMAVHHKPRALKAGRDAA